MAALGTVNVCQHGGGAAGNDFSGFLRGHHRAVRDDLQGAAERQNKLGDVWVGAAITALLFEIGKFLIGLYIGKSDVATAFGAAGPFVVLMLWIYYSTQIFLLGAEFAVAFSGRRNPQKSADARKPTSVHRHTASARLPLQQRRLLTISRG